MRTLQGWENDLIYPSTGRLQALIAILLKAATSLRKKMTPTGSGGETSTNGGSEHPQATPGGCT
jgi:hypothetical protein